MAGRVEGKVAFITGAARGMGRAHAVTLAREGADIIAVDLLKQVDGVAYPMSTQEDLAETVRQVEALDRRIVATQADVRDYDGLKLALDDGVAQLGRLDIVSANAGIVNYGTLEEFPEQIWQDMIDINLTGAWHTAKAAIPHLRTGGRGGSMIFSSSLAGQIPFTTAGHYTAAKHGVVGMMRTFALELAPEFIRSNAVLPGTVNTPMVQNLRHFKKFRPDLENPTLEDTVEVSRALNAIPVPWLESEDVSNAVLWLASDESRYVTGVAIPLDAGMSLKK
jgi:SDR family mycofactocin-dependent oxidoreductase